MRSTELNLSCDPSRSILTVYKNFGVRINGGAFTIADLEFHDTWVQNIKQT